MPWAFSDKHLFFFIFCWRFQKGTNIEVHLSECRIFFQFNGMHQQCVFFVVVYCMFSLRAKKKSYCQVCVQWAHPKDKGCNVQPQAAQSGCCAWHLGPLSLCRNWHGAGSSSKSQVLFYLSQSTSDLSRRTPQRDLPLRGCLLLHSSPLSHTPQWRMRSRAISQPGLSPDCLRNRRNMGL